MTNDELKKKIIETLKNTVVNYDCGHAIIAGYFYMEKVFVAFADALIAAGIGDISVMLEYVKSVGKHRDEERKNLIELQNIQLEDLQSRVKAAEHRAEVAERALERTVFELLQAWGYSALMAVIRAEEFFIPEAIKEAEKELLEESKDD